VIRRRVIRRRRRVIRYRVIRRRRMIRVRRWCDGGAELREFHGDGKQNFRSPARRCRRLSQW
jgi:hypothetical protein